MLSEWSGLGTRLVSCLTSRLKAFVGLSGETDMMGKSAVLSNYSREEIIKFSLITAGNHSLIFLTKCPEN